MSIAIALPGCVHLPTIGNIYGSLDRPINTGNGEFGPQSFQPPGQQPGNLRDFDFRRTFFITNRVLAGEQQVEGAMNPRVTSGYVNAWVSRLRRRGQTASNTVYRSGPAIWLEPHRELSEPEFAVALQQNLVQTQSQDVILFVHGYNSSFGNVLARMAQWNIDSCFRGPVVAFCWPSAGQLHSYRDDGLAAQASIPAFAESIRRVRAAIPPGTRLHLLAHSMGGRIACRTLADRDLTGPDVGFDNLVLCAPDVGRTEFVCMWPGIRPHARHATLYSSYSDLALSLSGFLNDEARVGDAGVPVVLPGLDTVDASAVDRSLLGHEYFADNPSVLEDQNALFMRNQPADFRPQLEPRWSATGKFYRFRRFLPFAIPERL